MRTLSEGQSEIFDVVAVIQEFVTDETQSQLQLPNLTAAQRKQAKTVVERHCELTCESFGFGTERQLHIFKHSHRAVPHRGRDGSDGPPESFAPKSTSGQLEKSSLTEHGGDFHLAPIKERPCESPELERSSSSDGSTTASTPPTDIRGCLSEQPWPSLPSGLSVRNTFIDVEGEHADEREVQSMPHGMFGHYLRSELNERQSAKIDDTPSGSPAVVDASVLAPGTVVIINGLQKLPAFNGSTGAVQSFDQESGRYSILLATPAGGHHSAKVKPENIQVLSSASHPQTNYVSSPLVNHIPGPHRAMDLQGFPSTPGWDDGVHRPQLFSR